MTQNTLMFEVGVSLAEEQFNGIKAQMQKYMGKWEEALNIKVGIENLTELTNKLNEIGDSKGLQNLRREVEALNKEFLQLSKGAGGDGSFLKRGIEQQIVKETQRLEDYNKQIRELEEARTNLRGGKLNPNYAGKTQEMDRLKSASEGVMSNIEKLKKDLDNLGNTSVKTPVSDIGKLGDALQTVGENSVGIGKVSGEMAELKGNVDSLTKSVSELVEQLKKTSEASGTKKAKSTAQEDADASKEAAKSKDEEAEKERKLAIAEENRLRLLKQLEDQIKRITNIYSQADKLNIDQSAIGGALAAFNKFLQETSNKKFDPEMFKATFGRLKTEYQDVIREADKYNKVTEKTNGTAQQALQKEYTARQRNADAIRKEAEASLEARQKFLQGQAASLGKILSGGRDKLDTFQYDQVRNALRAIREELRQIETAKQRGGLSANALFSLGGGTANFSSLIAAYEKFVSGKHAATSANTQLIASEQSLASAVKASADSIGGQSKVLSDLKTMAMQYLSVWGAKTFINNIIELGGQLEQQRLSIGAILQDTAQANHLFGQIKDLAIKSPFGVQQLDAMSKQLSAYGFKYSELYEWTKRLADISAATGTSVDRLALALGHVRSEGALSGYTLRQFSMGNIPLLEKLSKNLGKTKQEIRKMTRNKEIGYEDVLNVLKELTDEGGMFFEAQETMAQALNAKFKNLRDSFQIMYSEMAEGAPGDFLKGVAEVLTDISRSWRVLMPVILSGAGAFGVLKVSTMLMNYELAKEAALTSKTATVKNRYVASTNAQIAATGRWTLALKGLGRALSSIGKFIFNPVTLGFAAVEGLIYLWSKHNDEVRKAEELTKAFSETAVESQKNIGKQLEQIKPYEKGMNNSQLQTGIETMTESLKNYGINAQKVLNEAFGRDSEGNVMSLADKYQYLRSEMGKTLSIYKEMEKTANAFEYGIRQSSQTWADDDVQTDLTQYAEALRDFEDVVTEVSEKYNDNVWNIVEVAQLADPVFKNATANMVSNGEKLGELFSNFDKYKQAYAAIEPWLQGQEFREVYAASNGYLNFASKKNEAMRELDKFIKDTESRLKEHGFDFSKKLAPEQIGALLKESKDWLEKHPEWGNIYNVIEKKLEEKWPIKFEPDVEPVKEELPQWMQDIQNELNQEKTGIQIKAGMSMEQIIDEALKAYQAAETTINKLGPIVMKAGIKIEGLTDEVIEKYGPASGKNYNPEFYNTLLEAKRALEKKNLTGTFGKNRGHDFHNMKKDGTHKAEKQNQEAAKAVREQVRVIKEAADAFQYWREKVGDKSAWAHVEREFGDVLNTIDITAKNVNDLRDNLDKVKTTKAYKSIRDKKIRTEIDKEIAKDKDQTFARKDFEKESSEYLSTMQRDIDELTRKWDIFNSVLETTGDRMLAARLTGIAPGATPADLKRLNVTQFAGAQIDFDRVLGMSDKDIDEYVNSLGIVEEKIEAVRNGLKDWKAAEQQQMTSYIENYAKWLGSLVDLESIRMRNQEEYNGVLKETNRLLDKGVITQEEADRRKNAAALTQSTKDWQATSMYANLYNRSQVMAEDEFYKAYNKESANLFDQYKQGSISLEDYTEKMRKLNDVASEFSSRGFLGIRGGVGAYLSGGYQGLINYRKNRADELRSQGKDDEAKQEDAEAASMEKQLKVANQVVQAFQELADGADLLAGLFDEMGWEGGSNAMSDASDLLGGALGGASKLSALGPWGMAAGAGLGFLSAGFQLQDKSIQREIDALKKHADTIQENTDAIKSARERTLGYDTGTLRRQMSARYSSDALTVKTIKTIFGDLQAIAADKAVRAMNAYYSKNSGSSGYAAELENLRAQREDYMKMYNLEEGKKKKSDEALKEYKQKIAELDEQIMYFAEDLANELYGIDFKSWADQISDALWTAFENGEDAVKAFGDTAKDIVSDVAKKMMNIHLIEPAFQALEDALFGTMVNGVRVGGKAYNASTGEFNESETLRILGEFFGEDGEFAKVVESAEGFYKMAGKAAGMDFAADDSSTSTASGIKGVSEQTADMLAGYINAIRADVSVNRSLLMHMVQQYWPDHIRMMTSGTQSLRNIEGHTAAIMRSNQGILDRIDGLKNNTWKVPVA